MDRSAVLVVSFGTSYPDTLVACIERTEQQIHQAFPGWSLRRAFTSQAIISKLARGDVHVQEPKQALQSLVDEGFSRVIVQPLHIIPGFEYHEVVQAVDIVRCANVFQTIALGEPLLYHQSDYEAVVDALAENVGAIDSDEAILFMGHGTEHFSNACYYCLQGVMEEKGFPGFVAVVANKPSLGAVVGAMRKRSIRNVVLMPFMLVAGDHVRNDMVGEDSWENYLKVGGFGVCSVLRGLGENKGIRDLFVRKALAACEAVSKREALS